MEFIQYEEMSERGKCNCSLTTVLTQESKSSPIWSITEDSFLFRTAAICSSIETKIQRKGPNERKRKENKIPKWWCYVYAFSILYWIRRNLVFNHQSIILPCFWGSNTQFLNVSKKLMQACVPCICKISSKLVKMFLMSAGGRMASLESLW